MINFLKRLSWPTILIIIGLIVFDMSVHPLTMGPDRLIHDPAVYRLNDSHYLPGDWYTDMAVKSSVYIFYAKLVLAGQFFHIPEELWRSLLYLASLGILYYSLVRIAQFFTNNILVVPISVLLHMMISTGDNQPIWLYGPFIQVDGGLAPRSIGIAISFLALYFLVRGSIIIPAFLLGLATFIHVSNSLIVFTLFFIVWLLVAIVTNKPKDKRSWLEIGRKAGLGFSVYLLAGGWFALYVAGLGSAGTTDFPTEKFIWSWIYFRAPYMALPLMTKYWWIRLFAHGGAIIFGWWLLRKRVSVDKKRALDLLALVGFVSIGYFFLFYLFAFIWPWLPGFQFYSIRVVYFAYFVAYLFISLCLLIIGREILSKLFLRLRISSERLISLALILAIMVFLGGFGARLGDTFRKPQLKNLRTSEYWLMDSSIILQSKVPNNHRILPPQSATFQYLLASRQPFLAPPDLRTGHYYLPNIASFKSFGFTKEGLPEWYYRLNDVSQGEIQRLYDEQIRLGRSAPVYIEWNRIYSTLTEAEVLTLSKKYNFKLFLTNSEILYSFPLVTQDADYRLYRLP